MVSTDVGVLGFCLCGHTLHLQPPPSSSSNFQFRCCINPHTFFSFLVPFSLVPLRAAPSVSLLHIVLLPLCGVLSVFLQVSLQFLLSLFHLFLQFLLLLFQFLFSRFHLFLFFLHSCLHPLFYRTNASLFHLSS